MIQLLALLPLLVTPQDVPSPQARRPLDVEASDRWNEIRGVQLARDGSWSLLTLTPAGPSDGHLQVEALGASEAAHTIERGTGGRFDAGARYVVCRVEAPRAEARQAEIDDLPAKERPKAAMAILHLASGARLEIEGVTDFAMAEEGGDYLAWRSEEKGSKKDKKSDDKEEGEEEEEKPSKADKRKTAAKAEGKSLVLRHLVSGAEHTFDDVTSYVFSKDGAWLAYAVSTKDGETDGAFVLELGEELGEPIALLEGKGDYGRAVFDEESTRLAFLADVADYEADQPRWSLYTWAPGDETAQVRLGHGDERLAEGQGVSRHRTPSFSKDGARLFFGLAPLPRPEPEDAPAEDDVVVDVWNWKDGYIQPMQLVNRKRELERSYLTVLHLADERLVSLATPERPDARVPDDGRSPRALVTSDLPYRQTLSWEGWTYDDVETVDVATGKRTPLLEAARGNFALSPGGQWVTWWDAENRQWMVLEADGSGEPRSLTAGLEVPFENELHDAPSDPRAHGAAGWLADDAAFLVHDRFDLWRFDPTGANEPQCITGGVGRERGVRLRFVDLDREEEWIAADEPLLLSAFDQATKADGFWRLASLPAPGSLAVLEELVSGPFDFGRPRRAEETDTLILTRENWVDFPDYWATTPDFEQFERISTANPWQAEYLWGGARPMAWKAPNGETLEGTLYTPEGFDESREYPMLVYFYERSSDNLHRYQSPVVSRSVVRFPTYTSRGYLVFVPDIPYTVGYPGRSSEEAVLSGIEHLVGQGFVDREAIGVQGHSWGGYQIAHLITRTDVFKAAVSGAPVSNMTSAYGGVRWASGMSRMFQYERTQSRIGETLWEARDLYLENSPVFFADQVSTPVLILHNDEDGAVPWYQGIEFFMALRRLGKESWLLNYNGEGHGIGKYAHRRDYALRMQQFFDHYLLGEPAPRWLAEGRPATDKGFDLGLGPADTRADATTSRSPTPMEAGTSR